MKRTAKPARIKAKINLKFILNLLPDQFKEIRIDMPNIFKIRYKLIKSFFLLKILKIKKSLHQLCYNLTK